MERLAFEIDEKNSDCYDYFVNLTEYKVIQGIDDQITNHSVQMNGILVDVMSGLNITKLLYDNETIESFNRMVLYDNEFGCSIKRDSDAIILMKDPYWEYVNISNDVEQVFYEATSYSRDDVYGSDNFTTFKNQMIDVCFQSEYCNG